MSRAKSKVPRPRADASPDYPRAGRVDPSRRRFLAQLSASAGGLGLFSALGLPRLAHGQSEAVDFSVLDAHPSPTALAPPAPPAMAAPAAPMPAPAPPAASAPSQAAAEPVEMVTEHRALFVEPGYIVLLRWERPAGDTAVVAALEGSTEAVSAYLSANIDEMNDLHDIDRLHTHEHDLVELLQARVAPATIEVLHLDHDCNSVCGARGWTGPDPDFIPLPGVPPAPEFPE